MGGRRRSEGGEKSEQERLISIFGRKSGKIIDVHNRNDGRTKFPMTLCFSFLNKCARMYLWSYNLIGATLSFGF